MHRLRPTRIMTVTGHHMGIVVDDLEAAVTYYTQYFDMEEQFRLTTDGEPFGKLLGIDRPAPANIAFLETADGFTLELEEHEAGERDVNALTDPTDVGYPHVCFEVPDIKSFYDEWKDDIDFLSPPGSATDSGATIIYCRDPSDNLVELIETA